MFSVRTEAGLLTLNDLLVKQPYLGGFQPEYDDFLRHSELRVKPGMDFPQARRWYEHIYYLKNEFPNRLWKGTPADVAQAKKGGAVPAQKGGEQNARYGQKKGSGGDKKKAGEKGGDDQKKDGGKGKDAANLTNVLKGAVFGKVVTRFPPEPSGYLHIGHARAALTNHEYARMFGGKFICRFDDTNPSKEKAEFEESIIEDLARLEIKADMVTHTSDYFEKIQSLMEMVIKDGHAYCDDTEMLTMREERDVGTESKRRNNSVQENLDRFKDMLKGNAVGVTYCVRGKMDMTNKNKCLRDPVFYRCKVDVPHHRHGTKYKAYPTYDFACPVVDSLEGVTHPLRTIEYRDRDKMYEWVLERCGFGPLPIVEFSKSQFMYTILSKRKLQQLVELKVVSGWDDPRFPTIQGIVRRGMTVAALLEFVMTQAASKNTNLMSWDKIWAINKQKIDLVVPRYAAVEDEEAVKFELSDGPKEPYGKMIARHPKNEELGERLQQYSKTVIVKRADAKLLTKGEEFTLLHWGNAIVEEIKTGKNGEVLSMKGKLNPKGSPKDTKWKLHWVPDIENVTKCILREYDHVLTKPKMEDDDELKDFINYDSQKDIPSKGDPSLKNLQKGDKIQLERRGYFIVDQVPFRGEPMVLIEIPDGRAKTMGGEAKMEGGAVIDTTNKASKAKNDGGKAALAAKAAPAAKAAGGGDPVKIAAELEKVKNEVMAKKKELKEGGMSGKQVNTNEDVVKLVAKMTELKAQAEAAASAPAPAAAAAAAPKAAAKGGKPGDRALDDITRLDIRVGKITKVWAHPESDKLWCEEVDLGEGSVRTIASGLQKFVPEKEMLGAMVVVLCNLKPRKMVGFMSQGMVMCASGDDKVQLLQPPKGVEIGERITFEGLTGEADEKLNEKTGKAPLVELFPHMKTNSAAKPNPCFKGIPFMTSKGPITCKDLKDVDVR